MNTSNIQLVIFDLDGTLLDAFDDIQAALNHALRRCGLPEHPMESVRRFVGDGIENLVRRSLQPEDAHRFSEVLPLVAGYYREHPAGTARLYPGVAEALRQARSASLKLAILTNKPHAIALEACQRLRLAALVDRVQGEDADHPLKPDPLSALALAREFGVAPGNCAIVGDGRADVDLARAAEMRIIACAWGTLSREEIEALHPDAVIGSMAEFMDAVRSLSET